MVRHRQYKTRPLPPNLFHCIDGGGHFQFCAPPSLFVFRLTPQPKTHISKPADGTADDAGNPFTGIPDKIVLESSSIYDGVFLDFAEIPDKIVPESSSIYDGAFLDFVEIPDKNVPESSKQAVFSEK